MPAAPCTTDPTALALAFVIATAAGAINSLAGGGTLLTYPVIFALVGDGKVANITSTLGLWPGSLGGAWGYRREMAPHLRRFASFFLISFLGGGLGGLLLLFTRSATFERLAPLLILGATGAFMVQSLIADWLARRQVADRPPSTARWLGVGLLQLAVAVYGGYFGAGIGIMMLALLGFLGLTDLFEMNGLKNLAALCINAIAILQFIVADRLVQRTIDWPVVGVMAAGAVLGGYFCAGLAKRLGPRRARWLIIFVGLGGAAWTAWKTWA